MKKLLVFFGIILLLLVPSVGEADKIIFLGGGGIASVSKDPTPTLGGELDADSNKIVNLANPTASTDAVNLHTLLENVELNLHYWFGSGTLDLLLTDSEDVLLETPDADPKTLTTILFKSLVADTPAPFLISAGAIISIHYAADVTSTSGKHDEQLKFQLFYVDADGTSNASQIGADSDLNAVLTATKTLYANHIHVSSDTTVPSGKRLWLKVIADATLGGSSYPEINFYFDAVEHHLSFGIGGEVLENFVLKSGDTMTGALTLPDLTVTAVEDPFLTFDALDAQDTDWSIGTNADAGASSDDPFELRTSATPGSGVFLSVDPSSGSELFTFNYAGTFKGVLTIIPDGTNEVLQVNDGTIDVTDGNAGTIGTITISSAGDIAHNKNISAATYASDKSVSDTELKFINTVSSNVQDQLDVVSSSGARSAIINGDFNIWQRGTSFATVTGGDTYTADRFTYGEVGDAVVTITRDSDVPTQTESGHLSNYSLKIDVTTIDGAVAAGDYVLLKHKIEGYNFAPFQGKTATLSFWVKAVKAGIYCIALQSSTSDESYVAEYTISSTSTWEKKTIMIALDYSAGTWSYISGIGVQVTWTLMSGTDFHGTADTWESATDIATSNQVNGVDNTANNFWLAQVQFELGSVATDFEYRQFGDELAKAQRYYWKTYPQSVVPGTAAVSSMHTVSMTALASADHQIRLSVHFPVTMRFAPTITLYDNAGTSGKVSMAVGDNITGTADLLGESGFRGSGTNGAVSTSRILQFQVTASAEL